MGTKNHTGVCDNKKTVGKIMDVEKAGDLVLQIQKVIDPNLGQRGGF